MLDQLGSHNIWYLKCSCMTKLKLCRLSNYAPPPFGPPCIVMQAAALLPHPTHSYNEEPLKSIFWVETMLDGNCIVKMHCRQPHCINCIWLFSTRLNRFNKTHFSSTSENGYGVLVCPDAQPTDQGAYSCEAINGQGSVFATPDAIVVVKGIPAKQCQPPFFNSLALSQEDCLNCFCFGVTNDCYSSDMSIMQVCTHAPLKCLWTVYCCYALVYILPS